MNIPVLFWTGISLLGLVLSWWLAKESRKDVRAMGPRANGRRAIAQSRFWRESIRVSVHGLYLLAALIVLDVVPLDTALVVPILIYGNVAMVANSFIDHRYRGYMYATRHGEPPIEQDGEHAQ